MTPCYSGNTDFPGACVPLLTQSQIPQLAVTEAGPLGTRRETAQRLDLSAAPHMVSSYNHVRPGPNRETRYSWPGGTHPLSPSAMTPKQLLSHQPPTFTSSTCCTLPGSKSLSLPVPCEHLTTPLLSLLVQLHWANT